MAINIFKPLRDLQDGELKSQRWYRNAVSLIADRVSAGKLMGQGKLLGRPSAGRMAMFYYDPKYKNTLPYYDRVPLVLPVDTIKGDFEGLNFQYLPYALRYRLLQNLQGYATNDKFNRTTRLDVDYSNIAGEGLVKPAIKKYLYAHVRSRFLRIDADEMAIAINLPVADFQGASLGSVFSKSRRMI